MPTYALLGATGGTGKAILRSLLSQPPKDLTLNIFVRSKDKLSAAFPDLDSTTAVKTQIFEGLPSDAAKLQDCLKDVDVVMAVIATNESKKGMSLIEDTAVSIIGALDVHRKAQGNAYKPPTILQLRSASLNETLKKSASWLGYTMAGFSFRYIYDDLLRAGKLFEASAAEEPKLLDIIYVDPPSIHDADGSTATGHKLMLEGPQHPTLNYADLGVAFCEIAERRDEFKGKGVGVTATGKVTETWPQLMGYMGTGMKSRFWG